MARYSLPQWPRTRAPPADSPGVPLERLEIFDEIPLLPGRQAQHEERVVVGDHIIECREPAVVEKSALLVCPETPEGGCAVAPIRCAVGLEIVNSDLRSRV